MKQENTFTFIIDTDSYGGDFQYHLCAYLTGRMGYCKIGSEMVELFKKSGVESFIDNGFDNLKEMPNENAPVRLEINPNYFHDGYGHYYKTVERNTGKPQMVKTYAESVEYQKKLEIKSLQEVVRSLNDNILVDGWTIPEIKKEINDLKKEIEKAKSLDKPPIFPAYNSVGIIFNSKPTEQQIFHMKARAFMFVEEFRKIMEKYNSKKQIKIEGFRLKNNQTNRILKII